MLTPDSSTDIIRLGKDTPVLDGNTVVRLEKVAKWDSVNPYGHVYRLTIHGPKGSFGSVFATEETLESWDMQVRSKRE